MEKTVHLHVSIPISWKKELEKEIFNIYIESGGRKHLSISKLVKQALCNKYPQLKEL